MTSLETLGAGGRLFLGGGRMIGGELGMDGGREGGGEGNGRGREERRRSEGGMGGQNLWCRRRSRAERQHGNVIKGTQGPSAN